MIQQSNPSRKYPSEQYTWTVSNTIVRDVWQELTLHPGASIRAIAQTTSHSTEAVARALHSLVELGYVAIPTGTRGARIIVLPCFPAEVHHDQ